MLLVSFFVLALTCKLRNECCHFCLLLLLLLLPLDHGNFLITQSGEERLQRNELTHTYGFLASSPTAAVCVEWYHAMKVFTQLSRQLTIN